MTRFGNLPLRYRPLRRLSALYAGLVLYGAGISAMVSARLGLDPWDVFHQGVARVAGVKLGWILIAVGAAVLLIWIPLRQRPGLGTVSNVLVIGLSANVVSEVLPDPHGLAARWAYAIGAILTTGVATGLYIGARYGPGPRDGLMTGIVTRLAERRFASVRAVRTSIELSVLAIGFLLGGSVGWVTLVYALSIGPLAHVFIPLFTVPDPPVPSGAAPHRSAVGPHGTPAAPSACGDDPPAVSHAAPGLDPAPAVTTA